MWGQFRPEHLRQQQQQQQQQQKPERNWKLNMKYNNEQLVPLMIWLTRLFTLGIVMTREIVMTTIRMLLWNVDMEVDG